MQKPGFHLDGRLHYYSEDSGAMLICIRNHLMWTKDT